MSKALRLIIGSTIAAMTLIAAPSASAATREQIKQCDRAANVSAEQRVASCNAVIETGTRTQKAAATRHKANALKVKNAAQKGKRHLLADRARHRQPRRWRRRKRDPRF